MVNALDQVRVSQETLLDSMRNITPLSALKKEEIDELQELEPSEGKARLPFAIYAKGRDALG